MVRAGADSGATTCQGASLSVRRVLALAASAVALLAVTGVAGAQPATAGIGGGASLAAVEAAAVDATGPYGSMRRTGSAAVALTFDDGPDPVVTPRLLDLLKSRRVKATFCVVGHRARDNQAIVRRIAAEGHTLCNHSWQHLQNLGRLDEAKIRKDLKATDKWIRRAVPGAQIQYFRAPYGNFTARLNRIARELGMTPLSWNVDDDAYQSARYGRGATMVAHMTKVVKRDTRKGSIVLSHEMAKPWTVTAYRTLLPWLQGRFRLVALPVRQAPVAQPAPVTIVITDPSPAADPTSGTPTPAPGTPTPAPGTPTPEPGTVAPTTPGPDPIVPDPIVPDPIGPDPIDLDPIGPDAIGLDPISPDPVAPAVAP
jgi:peptidoglycan/xylan/chitin deacetylase (PgdA/CDA1 family)